jgi:hypothetical protein
MKIQGPLVIDVSKWNDHLNIKELIDGGVTSVILGLYKQWNLFKYVLNDNCKRIIDQVSTSTLPLQTYFYYYPQNDPIKDADWFVDIMTGYPVKYAWADLENFDTPMEEYVRSDRNKRFMEQLILRFPRSGVYTADWYVDGFAPEMNQWLPRYNAWVAHWGRQPSLKTPMTWEQLKTNWLPDYEMKLADGQVQSKVMGHQFTGDRCILPGVLSKYNVRMPLDVSVFKPEFMKALGVVVPTPPPPPVLLDYVVNVPAINVRKTPDQSLPRVTYLVQGTIVHLKSVNTINGYAQMTDGNWVYFQYLIKKV